MPKPIQHVNVDAASIIQLYWDGDQPLGTLEFDAHRGVVFTDAVSARTSVVRKPNLQHAVPAGSKLERVSYRCRVLMPDDEPEEGYYVEGYFTGAVDTWGKLTFQPLNQAQPLYLFADEIVDREDA